MNRIDDIMKKYNEALHLNEVLFTEPYLLDKHYEKHVATNADGRLRMDFMSKDDYNELADRLSTAHAGKLSDRNSRVIGYTAKGGNFIKYDKVTNLLVAYNKRTAKSLYKQPFGKFLRTARGERGRPDHAYAADLPPEES